MSEEGALLSLLRCLEGLYAEGINPTTLSLCKINPEWGPHIKITGLCRALQSLEYVCLSLKEKTLWALTPEGEEYAAAGTPEANLANWLYQHPNVNPKP